MYSALIAIFFFAVTSVFAEQVIICSQNLDNLGLPNAKSGREILDQQQHAFKVKALIKRFTEQKCDLIAVQEIMSKSVSQGEQVLNYLSQALGALGIEYAAIAGESNDPFSRVGFVYNSSRFKLIKQQSYYTDELPKLSQNQRPRRFSRGPLSAQFALRSAPTKEIVLITFHFKSKYAAARDPAKREWETARVEMAERLREISAGYLTKARDNLLVVIGDRNSEPRSASARILTGEMRLSDFQRQGNCAISKKGFAYCGAPVNHQAVLRSVFSATDLANLLGTHEYKGKRYWLDEILIPRGQESAVAGRGIIYRKDGASDHALTWVKMKLD
jgi:endonuclease/exonuclease/phosphatase family metal-dependent hydrolase